MVLRWQRAFPGEPVPLVGGLLFGGADGAVTPPAYTALFTSHGLFMIFFAVTPILLGGIGTFVVPLAIGARRMALPAPHRARVLADLRGPGDRRGRRWPCRRTRRRPAGPASRRCRPARARPAPARPCSWSPSPWPAPPPPSDSINLVRHGHHLPRARHDGAAPAAVGLGRDPGRGAVGAVRADPPRRDRAAPARPGGRHGGVRGRRGDPVLYQHLFWIFGHPEVYILILPVWGVLGDLVAFFSRRPAFWYGGQVLAMGSVASMAALVYGHHMFRAGLSPVVGAGFELLTLAISAPATVLMVNWLATLWRGSLRLTTPMLFSLGTIAVLGLGGLSGLFLGSITLDIYLHDTMWVVGHFHLIMAAATLLGSFAAIHFWFPKMTGRMLGERLGRVHFAGTLVFAVAAFGGMLALGYLGQPRRYFDSAGLGYLDGARALDRWVSWSAFALGAFQLVFFANLFVSLRRGRPAGENPWQAPTLEWATSSPPPADNFAARRGWRAVPTSSARRARTGGTGSGRGTIADRRRGERPRGRRRGRARTRRGAKAWAGGGLGTRREVRPARRRRGPHDDRRRPRHRGRGAPPGVRVPGRPGRRGPVARVGRLPRRADRRGADRGAGGRAVAVAARSPPAGGGRGCSRGRNPGLVGILASGPGHHAGRGAGRPATRCWSRRWRWPRCAASARLRAPPPPRSCRCGRPRAPRRRAGGARAGRPREPPLAAVAGLVIAVAVGRVRRGRAATRCWAAGGSPASGWPAASACTSATARPATASAATGSARPRPSSRRRRATFAPRRSSSRPPPRATCRPTPTSPGSSATGLEGTAMRPWPIPDGELGAIVNYIKTFSPPRRGFRDRGRRQRRPPTPPDPYAAPGRRPRRAPRAPVSTTRCSSASSATRLTPARPSWPRGGPGRAWSRPTRRCRAGRRPTAACSCRPTSAATRCASRASRPTSFAIIAHGMQGPMPAYGHLGADRIWAVAHYVAALAAERAPRSSYSRGATCSRGHRVTS